MGVSLSLLPKCVIIRTGTGDLTVTQPWVLFFLACQAGLLSTLLVLLQLSLTSHTSPGLLLGGSFGGLSPCANPVQPSQKYTQLQLQSLSQSQVGPSPTVTGTTTATETATPPPAAAAGCVLRDTEQTQQGQRGAGTPHAHLYNAGTGTGAPLFPRGFTSFQTLFRNSKSDKRIHHFGRMYAEYLDPLRLQQPAVNMLEIGLRDGDSIQLWLSAFPRGKIYGLEYNPQMQRDTDMHPVLRRRVRVFTGDQANATLLREIVRKVEREVGLLDFIVDDGGHSMEQQIVSFTHLMPLVKPGGVYFIEDLQTSYWSSCHIHTWKREKYCYGGGAVGKKNTTIDMIKSFIDVLNADFIEDHPDNKRSRFGTGVYRVNPSDRLIGSVQCWRNMCAFRRKYKNSHL